MTRIFRSARGEQAVLDRYRHFLSLWPVPAEHLRVSTSLGEAFVVASGPKDAPPVILLHGSSSNTSMWLGDVATWARTHRVYAIDMVGEPGLSAPTRAPLASGVYGSWVDEVVRGLGCERVAVVGMSLGGWLALAYATAFPTKVERLVLICPAGIGRNKNVLIWAVPLLLLGPWGQRKVFERIGGKMSKTPTPDELAYADFASLIGRNYIPRLDTLKIYGDEAVGRLTMPIYAVLAGKDVFIDSIGVKHRLEALTPNPEILFVQDSRHLLIGFAAQIGAFLDRVEAA